MKPLPEKILKRISNNSFEKNLVGMSDSSVYVFDKYVLKIQMYSDECQNEINAIRFLENRIPVPIIYEFIVENSIAYTLMSRMEGKMLCEDYYMRSPELLVELVAQALELLWSVPIISCPLQTSLLDNRLLQAKYNVEHNLVDVEDSEVGTFGRNGFANPGELLGWLLENQPEVDLVFSHGDLCLPNILAKGDTVCGFIDLGKMGPADRWQDIALAMRSMQHNFDGKYNGGLSYNGYCSNLLLNRLQLKLDPKKLKYYILLDELF